MGNANVIRLWLKSLASRDSRHGDAVKSRVKSIMDIVHKFPLELPRRNWRGFFI